MVLGLASVSSLATLTLPSYSWAIWSTIGAIILQGWHHSAQKSTSTGSPESSTSSSKDESVTANGFAIGVLTPRCRLSAARRRTHFSDEVRSRGLTLPRG